MKVIIRETGKRETLQIIDPKTGLNWAEDMVRNHYGLDDGQFEYDRENGVYYATQETFDWWERVLADHQKMEDRIHQLREEHHDENGNDPVHEAIKAAGDHDLEDLPAAVHAALDEAFGAQSGN